MPQPQRRAEGAEGGVPSMPLRPGEWQPTEIAPPPKPPEDKDKDKDKDKDNRDKRRDRSSSQRRGSDWAQREAARGGVPITRPIRVDLLPDRLVLAPDRPGGAAKEIPLGERTATAANALTSAVWDRIESWGMAGKGMYWRPELNVYTAPGAEWRLADLTRAMEGSGIAVQRKL